MSRLIGLESCCFGYLLWPAAVAIVIALVVARLNARFGYGAYNDMEKAIIKAWRRQKHEHH